MNIQWDAENYTEKFSFVHKYGEDVLELIDAPDGSFAVDLGCGNGALTEKLAQRGFRTLGLDASPEMIKTAKRLHPGLDFVTADAKNFTLKEKADVIFSNAVFHWIDGNHQEKMIQHVSEQLKIGGELVCEFGGKGCAEAVHSTLEKSFAGRGRSYPRTFYFPSVGEYAPMLEKYGFLVEYAVLFDRPTEQQGENGLEDWIRMFVQKPFEGMTTEIRDSMIRETVDRLRPTLCVNGKWFVDYVRIRIKARKVAGAGESSRD